MADTIDTFFFPVDLCYREYFTAWVTELRMVHLFGGEDPVLPKVPSYFGIVNGNVQEKPIRAFHADGNNIRHAIKAAFISHGMPSFRLHAFRKTLAMLGNELCQTPEELKAWSQNLGHESIATTVNDYMPVSSYRQRQIISGLAKRAFP